MHQAGPPHTKTFGGDDGMTEHNTMPAKPLGLVRALIGGAVMEEQLRISGMAGVR